MTAVVDMLTMVSQLDPQQQKEYFDQNPEDKKLHLKMSKRLRAYINSSKCVSKRAVEAATDGWWGNITVPAALLLLGVGGVGGGWFLGEKIISD
jgi:hypothetical protein